MTVRCECCGGVTATKDGSPVICVRCVLELESCRPLSGAEMEAARADPA